MNRKFDIIQKIERNMNVLQGDRIANQFLINQIVGKFDPTETIFINITNDELQSADDLIVPSNGLSVDLPGNEIGLRILEKIIADKESRLYNASCIILLNFQNMSFYDENTLRDILNVNYDVQFVMAVDQ